MIYAILMAVAFVAAASLATILIVTRKKGTEDAEDEYEAVYTPVSDKRADYPRTDRRELIFNGQRCDRSDYGYRESNPICTASVHSSEKYLALLRTDAGEPLQWIREGSISVENLHGAGPVNEEVYTLYLYGERYRKLYICPYGKNSTNVPEGLSLAPNGETAPYGGSVTLEAKEKGITEQQVLAKQALIYENNPHHVKQEPPPREEAPVVKPFEPAESPKKAEESSSPASFPSYLPGFEPENVRPALERFLSVVESRYPDHRIQSSTWDHEKWDKAASMLCRVLGYNNGSEFLEAYGFTVEKDL